MPESDLFNYALGMFYIRNQEKPTAITYFKKATELAPTNIKCHWSFAKYSAWPTWEHGRVDCFIIDQHMGKDCKQSGGQ